MITNLLSHSIKTKGSKFVWHSIIWDKAIIPKHVIISFLADHNTLLTFDNLMRRGFNGPNLCALCEKGEESISNLLFSYSFSKLVLAPIKAWIKLMHVSNNLKQIMWLVWRHLKLDKWRCKLAKVAIVATIYCLLMERNTRIFDGNPSPTINLIGQIKFFASTQMLSIPDHREENTRMSFLLD